MLLASLFSLGLLPVQAAELSIPHEIYTLENGLTVILHEDHDLPLVQVNVWYHVGSKDEEKGRSGFAHLFEHLMFQGSEHVQGEYFEHLQKVGGSINGTTNVDRTNYFEKVPAEYLPLALWLEADRMGWLLEALTQEKLDNQREVVKNERRQSYENRPYGTSWMTLMEAVYPTDHPYEHTTIGSHEDLSAANLEDVKTFFRTWYVPNNASLVVAGDFDPDTAKALVEQYFGPIASGEEPTPRTDEMFALEENIEIRQNEAGVPFQKVWIAWPSAPLYAEGDAELDLLTSVLSGGKDSRLYRVLVHEKQIAKSVSAAQVSRRLTSMYMIQATAAEGHTTDEIVAEIDSILREVAAEAPTKDEVEIGRTTWEARFVRDLQSLHSRANQLNSYFLLTGQPDSIEMDLGRYGAVTPEAIQQAAAALTEANRVTLHIHPEEK
jgi:zinc protease